VRNSKARVVLELIAGEKGLMQASREYEIKDSVLSRWKQEFVERAPQLFEQAQTANHKKSAIAELEADDWAIALQLDMAKKVIRALQLPNEGEASDGTQSGRLV